MVKETVTTALSLVAQLPSYILRSAKSESLIEFTKPTRVEPIVLMDDRVVNLSYASDIMQSLTSIFSAYYLQAVALQVNVGRVDVVDLLDSVNPNRSLDDNLIKGATNFSLRTGMENATSYKYGLPVPGEPVGLEHFGLENVYDDLDKLSSGDKADAEETGELITSTKDSISVAKEMSNLSVGKILEVEIQSGDHKAVFPVQVRLIATAAPPRGIVHTLTLGSKNTTVKERFHAWRSGQLEFVRDLVMAQDLIDAHKEGLLKDTSDIYSTSIKRRRKNRLSALLTGNPSVATASNIIVLADATRKEVEREIGGRLKDFRTRQKIFKDTYAMLLVVVDPDWDNVTIYHRSIETPSEMSASDLKNASKGNGPDVGEILKAYQLGNSPSL